MDASGTRKHVQAAQVREKVERILSDPSYKLNAQRISKKLRAFGGPSYAADLMERSL
jgi:UDP:flavonoid glycosyltransferase YjiC (YdhE family)